MLKSIYTPLSGAVAQEKVLEVIANNLANINTTGFKEDKVAFTLLEPEPDKSYTTPIPPANYKIDLDKVMPFKGNDLTYAGVAEVATDYSQGPALNTKNPLDLMIEGEGFFTIQSQNGIRYSRAGNFSLSSDGALVTSRGDPVLGEKGAIYLRGTSFEVNSRGEVYNDGKLIDRLQVTKFPDNQRLERTGNGYIFFSGNPQQLQKISVPSIQQGFLEGSNVSPIKNLTAMIIAHRSFEAYQKAVSNYDQMMNKSSNNIGEIRA